MAGLEMTNLILAFDMSQPAIDRWAELSGDHNPLHVDPGYAETTKFGGTIAHGHIALSLMHHMFFLEYGKIWLTNGCLSDVNFRAPVRPGVKYQIAAIQSKETEHGNLVWDVEVIDLPDRTVCVIGRAAIPTPEPSTSANGA